MWQYSRRACIIALLAIVFLGIFASAAVAQRRQYKIQADGTVLKLKRINVTTFKYVAHARAELRRDGEGNSLWYFKAKTGKEYTAPAPAQGDPPTRYTVSQLNAAWEAAKTRGEIPTAVKKEQQRGSLIFLVKFEKNTLKLRWHAQSGMTAQEYEIVNRTLTEQGYRSLFAEPYLDREKMTRFVAAWRR